MRVLLVALLALYGCGSDDSDDSAGSGPAVSPTKPSLWTDEQLLNAKEGCFTAARNTAAATVPDTELFIACSCLMEAAGQRWAWLDFAAHEAQYTEQLKADGTVAKCNTQGKTGKSLID